MPEILTFCVVPGYKHPREYIQAATFAGCPSLPLWIPTCSGVSEQFPSEVEPLREADRWAGEDNDC